jgi:hypothetical protein
VGTDSHSSCFSLKSSARVAGERTFAHNAGMSKKKQQPGVWNRFSAWARRLGRRVVRPFGRVSGVNTPVGGVSWVPSTSEREKLRKFVVFLEDRRALFDPYNVEAEILVEQSVQQIRAELTKVLQSLNEDSRAGEPLRTMRSACQCYLTKAATFDKAPYWHHRPPRHPQGPFDGEENDFVLALGELRGAFGACLHQIASNYSIEVHGELAGLLPGATIEE